MPNPGIVPSEEEMRLVARVIDATGTKRVCETAGVARDTARKAAQGKPVLRSSLRMLIVACRRLEALERFTQEGL
jgi:hypothetical protein